MSLILTIDHGAKVLTAIDLATGKYVNDVKIKAAPYAVALSPSNAYLAFGTTDGTLIYNVGALEFVKMIKAEYVYTVAYSPNGKYLAAGVRQRVVHLYNASNYELYAEGSGLAEPIFSVTFSPSSKLLVSCTDDSQAVVWSVPSMTNICTLVGHADVCTELEYSLISCSYCLPVDSRVCVYI